MSRTKIRLPVTYLYFIRPCSLDLDFGGLRRRAEVALGSGVVFESHDVLSSSVDNAILNSASVKIVV